MTLFHLWAYGSYYEAQWVAMSPSDPLFGTHLVWSIGNAAFIMAEVFFCSPVVSSALSKSLDLSPSVCAQTGRHFYGPLGLWLFFSCEKDILLKAVEVKHRVFWVQKVPDEVKLSKWTGAFVPEKNTVLESNWLPPPVVIAVKIPLPTSPSAVECEDGVDRWAPCRSKGVIGRQPCVLSLPSSPSSISASWSRCLHLDTCLLFTLAPDKRFNVGCETLAKFKNKPFVKTAFTQILYVLLLIVFVSL